MAQLEPEPQPEEDLLPSGGEESDDEWPEDGEDGEDYEDEEGGDEDEDDEDMEEFVVNGTPLTEEQLKRRQARNGFKGAAATNDASRWKPPHVRRSKFVGRPYCCVFGLARDDATLPPGVIPCPAELAHLTFKCPNGRLTLGSAFKSGGFKRLLKGHEWNALWGKPKGGFRSMEAYQKVNHFPGTFQLGRKDCCARNVARMRRRVGAAQAPPFAKCYHLPQDTQELLSDMEAAKVPMFIVKPNASSRGRGIRVISHKHEVPRARKCMIQQYHHPLFHCIQNLAQSRGARFISGTSRIILQCLEFAIRF
eukprot:COSAG05_NODE_941_length_6510_cov_42.192482_1_plen_308_part_00